ncbi:MAG: ATP-binding cassette domain-containing protein [Chloroflexi bacterium]|nr:ATP-binding cassette domain-containing protein [Chloroflexota bacterium]
MIQVEGLTKQYGAVQALHGISFDVPRGEILGFLGPNGAGKTTTMRILTGYMPPSAGTVTIDGMDVFDDSMAVRRIVGYMPETVPLYTEMTVQDYLDFMAAIRRVSGRRAAVERVIEACAIGDVRDRIIGRLSKGYRQRVGLAQALVHDPQVLVLDEPTIGLDPRQILGVRELIKSLGGERTIILSSHILPEISQVCDRVMIMHRGRIVAEDTTEGLTERLQGGMRVRIQIAKTREDTVPRIAAVAGVASVESGEDGQFDVVCEPGQDVRAGLAALAVGQGWGLLELRVASLSLEEIFIQLTTDEAPVEAEPEPTVAAE